MNTITEPPKKARLIPALDMAEAEGLLKSVKEKAKPIGDATPLT